MLFSARLLSLIVSGKITHTVAFSGGSPLHITVSYSIVQIHHRLLLRAVAGTTATKMSVWVTCCCVTSYPPTEQLEVTVNIRYLTVSRGRKFKNSLAEGFWLTVSH